jgi:hypothetical protein
MHRAKIGAHHPAPTAQVIVKLVPGDILER